MNLHRGIILLAAWLGFSALAETAWARGGGGCLEEGTQISTPAGPRAIETLRPGDAVWSIMAGQMVTAKVQACYRVEPEGYRELRSGETILRITPEHPVGTNPGEFTAAEQLSPHGPLLLWRENRARIVRIDSGRNVPASRPAYNLLVQPGGTFLANGVIVHNKGCFLPDTPILLADGRSLPISQVRPGDRVRAFTPNGQIVSTTVREVIMLTVDRYMEVRTDSALLQVTADHPFYVGGGVFKTLAALQTGDRIVAWDGKGLNPQRILFCSAVEQPVTVYNLRTDDPHTFFAAGLAVHNKGGGCFPAGTRIRTPAGDRQIETLTPGSRVLAVGADGTTQATPVEAIYLARSPLVVLETDAGPLHTTAEHPLRVAEGSFVPAGQLADDDQLVQLREGRLQPVRIRQVRRLADEEWVYNLRVGPPHTYLAEGFVVHNKGGSSGGHSFSSGGHRSWGRSYAHGYASSQPANSWLTGVFVLVIGGFIGYHVFNLIRNIYQSTKGSDGTALSASLRGSSGRMSSGSYGGGVELDQRCDPALVTRKASQTRGLLEQLARRDSTLEPEELLKTAREMFLEMQRCWQAREYWPMQARLMPDLFAQHLAQVNAMLGQHEINKIENVTIQRLDLVHLRYTVQPQERSFTVLISASARDYYVDDRDQSFLRGDTSPAAFQEFWTFQYHNAHWLLREIEQVAESSLLGEENHVENQDGEQSQGGEAAASPCDPDPRDKLGRRLSQLEKTNPAWNAGLIRDRARTVFTKVMMARERNDAGGFSIDLMTADLVDHLRGEVRQRQIGEESLQYRNFCIRKVEMAAIQPERNGQPAEISLRIAWHAQVSQLKRGAMASQDPDVTPRTEFCTFVLEDGGWKLKQIQEDMSTPGNP